MTGGVRKKPPYTGGCFLYEQVSWEKNAGGYGSCLMVIHARW
jgi:hypothetical protein